MNNNLVLWINGERGLASMIDSHEWDIDVKIQNLKDELSSFNTKQVKGKTYWYQWVRTDTGGKWKYMGAKDPRPNVTARIDKLLADKKKVKQTFKDKIHSSIGSHLIVDPKKLKTPHNESVKVKDVIRRSSGSSGK